MKVKVPALPICSIACSVLFCSLAVAAEPGMLPLTLKVSPTDKDVRLSYEATGLGKLRGILIRISNSAGKEVHNQEYRCTADPCTGELDPLPLPLGAYIVDAFAMGTNNSSLTDAYETFAIAVENLQPPTSYQPPVQAATPPSYQQQEYHSYDSTPDTVVESSPSSASSSDTFLPPLSFSSGAAVSSFGSSSSGGSSTSTFTSGSPSISSNSSLTVSGTPATGTNTTLPANFVPPAFMGKLPLPVVTTK